MYNIDAIYYIYYNISFIIVIVVVGIIIIIFIIIIAFTVITIIIVLEGKGSREAAVSLPGRAASPGVLVLSSLLWHPWRQNMHCIENTRNFLGFGEEWQELAMMCPEQVCAHENN